MRNIIVSHSLLLHKTYHHGVIMTCSLTPYIDNVVEFTIQQRESEN